MNEDQKNCPFCAEVIKAQAMKCKYCGTSLPHVPGAGVRQQVASPAAAVTPSELASERTRRRTFWGAAVAIVATFIGIALWMVSGPSKSDMEVQLKEDLQELIDQTAVLRAGGIEVQRVELIKGGSNTYVGQGVVTFRGVEHNVSLQVTVDGSRYMLQIEPRAFAFVAGAALGKEAGQVGATFNQASSRIAFVIEPASLQAWLSELNRDGTLAGAKRTLEAAGVINQENRVGMDYMAIYRTLKPTGLLGSQVIAINLEEDGENVAGCCRRPRIEMYLEGVGDLEDLQTLASDNRCSVMPNDTSLEDLQYGYRQYGVPSLELARVNILLRCDRMDVTDADSKADATPSGADAGEAKEGLESCKRGAGNMAEVFECEYAETEATIEEAELELRAVLSRNGFVEQMSLLLRSQVEWRSVRDADCQQEYDEALEESGGYAEGIRLECIQTLSEGRVEELRAFADLCSDSRDRSPCMVE